jgi:hypothetical protein
MKTLAKCSKFTPVGGKLTAVLIAAFLAALSEASLAQAPQPDPSKAIVWIQTDDKGERYVCVPKTGCDQKALTDDPVPLTPERCRPTPGGMVCS